MNKSEFIGAIAAKTDQPLSVAESMVNAFAETIKEEICNGGNVALVGFGTFEASERAARAGRNPKTGETIQIAASTSVKFKVGKALKDAVNSALTESA